MNIYLETVSHGEIIEIAEYNSPAVPRIGEKISLDLSAGGFTPTGGIVPYESTVLLRVVDVRYNANNTTKTEDWITPYSLRSESVSVAVSVSPESDDARQYIERCWRASQ